MAIFEHGLKFENLKVKASLFKEEVKLKTERKNGILNTMSTV